MIFRDLSGREYKKQISARDYVQDPDSRSSGEQWLQEALEEIFPLHTILEQFPCFGTRFRIDKVILSPGLRIAFEYDGRQHGEFVPHFHGSRAGHGRAMIRDAEKDRWCEVNDIIMIRIDKMDVEELRSQISERTK